MTRDPDMIRVSARHLRRLLGRAGRGGGNPARAFFVVMWETGLRYATLARIRARDSRSVTPC